LEAARLAALFSDVMAASQRVGAQNGPSSIKPATDTL
jgi:hypothetical protein